MTSDELKKRFPNASVAFLAANSGAAAALERDARPEPLATHEVQKVRAGKVRVCITSRRVRLADPDGLCEKYFLDCCRYAGLITGDTAREIELETRQEKVSKGECEETLIEIYEVTL